MQQKIVAPVLDDSKLDESVDSRKPAKLRMVRRDREDSNTSFNEKSAHTLDELRSEVTHQTPRRALKKVSTFEEPQMTSRSCKVHPESVLTTPRKIRYLEDNAVGPDDVIIESKSEKVFKLNTDAVKSKIVNRRARRFEEEDEPSKKYCI